MSDKDYPKINIHGHLRSDQDIPERMKIWDEWNVRYFCCLFVDEHFTWGGPDVRYFTNEDFPAVRREYGERIVGFAAVHALNEQVDTPADIERYKEQGFTGLKFCGNSYPYSHEIYYPVYEKAQELGMPILFHTGCLATDTPENARRYHIISENMRPYHLEAIGRSFDKLTIIGAHLGNPHCFEALQVISVFENAYYDFSGGGGGKPHVRKVLSSMLPHPGIETDMSDPQENRALAWFEKFCFGTDNPEPSIWVPNSEFIMDKLQIPEALRRRFYYDNAAGFLDLPPA